MYHLAHPKSSSWVYVTKWPWNTVTFDIITYELITEFELEVIYLFIYLKSMTEGPEGHLYCQKYTKIHRIHKHKLNKGNKQNTNNGAVQEYKKANYY